MHYPSGKEKKGYEDNSETIRNATSVPDPGGKAVSSGFRGGATSSISVGQDAAVQCFRDKTIHRGEGMGLTPQGQGVIPPPKGPRGQNIDPKRIILKF